MIEISVAADSLVKLAGKVEKFTVTIGPALEARDQEFAEKLLAQVNKNASGRPGPNVVTGKYRSMFMIVNGRVVNPSPQTRRLEYGFSGTDSEGRVFHQPPFPHIRPAMTVVSREFRESLPRFVISVWRKS